MKQTVPHIFSKNPAIWIIYNAKGGNKMREKRTTQPIHRMSDSYSVKKGEIHLLTNKKLGKIYKCELVFSTEYT